MYVKYSYKQTSGLNRTFFMPRKTIYYLFAKGELGDVREIEAELFIITSVR